jgi:hypothetical protein
METILAQIAQDFIRKLVNDMTAGESFSVIEKKVAQEVAQCAARITGAYLEYVDQAIAEDKEGRRRAGYAVERHKDSRSLMTTFGEVTYRRTYYRKDSGGYDYLLDTTMGIDSYLRLSQVYSLALADAGREMPYSKACRYTGGSLVSRQTVMECVRESNAADEESFSLRKIPELHVDADEAHITLHGGQKSSVPLISVYEGIGHEGSRNYCRNIFHISQYGKTVDDLWEQALTEVEKRYDLEGTRIYLHGDGAPWVQKGLEWLPQANFVLDKYHKNNAIMAMTAGLERNERKIIRRQIRKALSSEEAASLWQITQSLCMQLPERTDIILGNAGYLERFIKGISICTTDPLANNGGCSEPHVSHVLSNRLSSRPMTWSKATLQRLAPVLAAGKVGSVGKTKSEEPTESLRQPLQKTVAKAKRTFCKNTLGLPLPGAIGRLHITGKVTGTQVILKRYAG